MNPHLSYECKDITSETTRRYFDVVTLIEVLEHIPINSVDSFVSAVARYQESGGELILTVPHKNKPLQAKHYQHFNSHTLRKVIEPHYEVERMGFFDKRARIFTRLINSLLGNRLFLLNNRSLLDALFNVYRKHFLVCSEANCGRIGLVGRKK